MKRFLLKIILLILIAGLWSIMIPGVSADGCFIPQGDTGCQSGTPPVNPPPQYVVHQTLNCSIMPNGFELCSQPGCCCDGIAPDILGSAPVVKAYCDYLEGFDFNPAITNRDICQAYCEGTTINTYSIGGYVLNLNDIPQSGADVVITPGNIWDTSNPSGYYLFAQMTEGQTYTLTANLSDCSGSRTTTAPLFSNLGEFNITLSNCCNYQCPPWSEVSCVDGVQTRTCTSPNGCELYSETQSCTLPACDWECTDWNPPDSTCTQGQTQTRTCSKIPLNWPADQCQGDPPEPYLTKTCSAGTGNLCGNGVIDYGEMCDYNEDTGEFHSNCDPATIANCRFNDDCQCAGISPPPIDCAQDPVPPPPEDFFVRDVYRQRAFNLSWTILPACADYIDHFSLKRCAAFGQAGSCNLNWVNIASNLARTTNRYDDIPVNPPPPAIIANKTYCYNLTTYFNSSIIDPLKRVHTMVVCQNSGQELCLNPAPPGWCISNNARTCSSVDPPAGPGVNEFDDFPCDSNEFCTIGMSGSPLCIEERACEDCNSVLWMFGHQGYDLGIPEEAFTCPSLTNRINEYGCFIDYTYTAVDMTYSCSAVESCYDYESKKACEYDGYSPPRDICGKFVVNGQNGCEWAPYTNDLKKGVCRPKDVESQWCGKCNEQSYNRIYPQCTRDVCGLYGYCYFNKSNSKCLNGTDIVCGSYPEQTECTGISNQAVKVNVSYNSTNFRAFGTNIFLQESDDLMDIGRCKWLDSSSGCIKDADNSTTNDCTLLANTPLGKTLRKVCERDILSPNSTYEPRTNYGPVMDLSELAMTDNRPEWTIGDSITPDENDPKKRIGLWLYYCIDVPGGNAYGFCYPNTVLRTITNNPLIDYKIDLSGYDEGEWLFRYFAEDPAKNLEVIKEFVYVLDKTPPDIGLQLSYETYSTPQIPGDPNSPLLWFTNLGVNIALLGDASPPATCYFNLSLTPGWNPQYGTTQTYLDLHNIPTYANPDNVIGVGESLETTYPALESGRYAYDLTCYDDVGNKMNITYQVLDLDGDLTIDDPKPIFMQPPARSYELPALMSINTSANGTCRYSHNTTNYALMTKTFTPVDLGDGRYIHTAPLDAPLDTLFSSDAEPPVYETGIYRYYPACELYINNQWLIVAGTPADIIDFAIDESPPDTKLLYDKEFNNNWTPYVYNASEVNSTYWLQLECNDTISKLLDEDVTTGTPLDRAFGCSDPYSGGNASYWCLKHNLTDACTTYNIYDAWQWIILDYNTNTTLKSTYGNRPYICYHSVDEGNNTALDKCMRINIQGTQFNTPIIIVTDATP